MNPLLTRWHKYRGDKAGKEGDPILKRITVPLIFEPGTSWEYGYGIDWVGVLIMRLNKMSLEAYMQKYLWDPLGVKDITFHLELKPDVRKKLVKMTTRGNQDMHGIASPTEEIVEWTDKLLFEDPWLEEFGGAGTIGSALDYIKIVHSICADDGKLLMSETIKEMFTPQLGNGSQKVLTGAITFIPETDMFGSHKPGTELSYGLGGLLILRWGDGVKAWHPKLEWTTELIMDN
jgi:CubicO group peptidase (beta-lactamase class C family)